jgi:dTDP-4-amino-4,6-dideoxygalactose transaminase
VIRIPKVARSVGRFERPFRSFPSARAAFRHFLSRTCSLSQGGVLLPGYIGFSPREGSGVFDPVRELGLPFSFYRMRDTLEIDIEDLKRRLDADRPRVMLVIHYFGYADPASEEVIRLAKDRGVLVLEDEAHAMLTDLVAGKTGRMGEAAIFSYHKMLPVETGGALVVNPHGDGRWLEEVADDGLVASPTAFDLAGMAALRRRNASHLAGALESLKGRVDLLWNLPEDTVPQTLPVIVRAVSRDRLYERMNERGFGVVSLYHTMVDVIAEDEHPEAHALARRIMNLPVHQEAEIGDLDAMVVELDRLTRES